MSMNLEKLSDPFERQDIEWRVSRAGTNSKGIWCCVLAYVTARAIQKRLDGVCGPDKWRLEKPEPITVGNASGFMCGLSILCESGWVTKWDVSEPTHIEPIKGGWSGAMKRAGAQWGIGRYLYHLDEAFAETSDTSVSGWNYAKLPKDKGGESYYWKAPNLPGWALPKDTSISGSDLASLKKQWKQKRGQGLDSPADLRGGFEGFVEAAVGAFPYHDHTCWTVESLEKCRAILAKETTQDGPSSDVPFE